MKVRTSEATGPVLDWMVAKCEGFQNEAQYLVEDYGPDGSCDLVASCAFSTDWSQGGPIINRECINVCHHKELGAWVASKGSYSQHGGHALQAVMRCYVASKLGEEVEVPEELVK